MARGSAKGIISMKNNGGKGLFIALSWVAFVIVVIIAVLIVYLVSPRLAQIQTNLPKYLSFATGIVLIIVGGGLLLISIAGLFGIDVLYPHGGEPITMRILFPIVTRLGVLFGFKKDKMLEAFVDTNNALVWAQRKRFSNSRVLVLLPHCLQNHECKWKITFDISNCTGCGKCDISRIAEIAKNSETEVRVATGGTLARKVVSDYKPTLILAVACGRDLSSGIIDSHPIPVLGVINERPKGPCFDTKVDIEKIEKILKILLPVKK